jgi:adenine C2-methylase RlmN of 23S rRNA A2503 and tRNA A37
MEGRKLIKARSAKLSSWIWQSFVLEASMKTDLLKENVTKLSSSILANALSGVVSRWV